MATQKRRRRAVARARYERQLARRTATTRRRRRIAVVGWAIVGLLVLVGVIVLGVHLAQSGGNGASSAHLLVIR